MNKRLGELKNKIALLFLFIISCGFSTPIFAQTNTFNGATSVNWNTASNWSLNIVPTAAHDVIILNNKNVTVNTNAVCKTFTIDTGINNNTITISGSNSLTVTGAISILAPTANNRTKVIAVGTGTLTCASVVMATTIADSRDCRITTTSGIVNVSGNITMNGVALRNQLRIDGATTIGGTLNIGGNLSGGDFLSANNNSTVNFNGTSAQVIPINADYIFNKIIVNNAAGATLQAAVTTANVKDNITVQSGTLNNGGFAIAGNGTKTFTVDNGASLLLSGTTSAFPSGFGTNTLGATSSVEYKGTGAQTIFDVVTPGYGNLTISNNSIKTAAGGIDIQGNVTVNSSTMLAFTTFIHNIKGNLLNSGTVTVTTGTINVGGNWTNNGTFTPGVTGTVIFNSTTIGKTISGVTGKFNNLTFNGVNGGWTIANDLDVANKLTITNGAVCMSGTLSVAGNTPVTVAAGGTITLENNASLLQTGYTGANLGNIIYKRITPPIFNTDYTYWSSPVAGQTLYDVSPLTLSGKFYSYDSAAIPENWKQESSATVMAIGVGYIIRGPEPTPPIPPIMAPYQATFIGIPNNGSINIPIAGGQTSNLIGNPYPSAIDADLFLAANTASIDGTLYLWTHNTGINNGQYTDNDYASYNGTGGAAGSGGATPTGKIAAGQSFFTTSTAFGGTVTFTNAMRVAGNNSQFFKKRGSKTEKSIEKNRIWLNLTNTQGAFKQTLIGYVTDATNDYDSRFDGESFDGNEFVDFYSLNQEKNLVIQGRALPFDENDEIPLGYRTTINGDFTINIDQADGLLTNQAVFLEDKLTQKVFDLKGGNYTFNTVAGTFNDRFVLRYVNKTLGTKNFETTEKTVLVSNKNKQIKINSLAETIDKVEVYDLLGRKIYQKTKVDSNELSISNLVSSRQALVVKTSLNNGEIVTNKIIY